YILNELPNEHTEPRTISSSLPKPLPEMTVEAPTIQPIKTLRHWLYELRPKAYQIGLGGGWAMQDDARLAKKSGYSLGIKLGVDFSSHLSVWTDLSFFKTQQTSYRMGDDIGIPVVFPPTDTYKFEKEPGVKDMALVLGFVKDMK
ncbi:MAG: hypothetical protein ACKVOM_03195, partial [Ferruginibacter sp.]